MTNATLAALKALQPKIQPVAIGETTFYIRGLNGAERADFVRRQVAAKQGERPLPSEAEIVALTLVDADGARAIPSGDDAELHGVDGAIIGRLAKVAYEISGLLDDAKDTAEKN